MNQVRNVADRVPWPQQDFALFRVERDSEVFIDRRELGRIEEVAALKRWIVSGIREQGAKVFDLADGKQGLKHRTAVIGVECLKDKAAGLGVHETGQFDRSVLRPIVLVGSCTRKKISPGFRRWL